MSRPSRRALLLALPLLAAPLPRALAAESARRAEPLRVVTTLPVLADLTRQVGGERVTAESLADPREDPHYVQPRPTLMKRARRADVFVESGLQLELWADKVVAGSGNPDIQRGTPGRVVASDGIATLELPTQISREWGDVHPYGNPHLWLDPLRARAMAANIERGLEAVDPAGAEAYQAGLKDFQHRIDVALFGQELVEEVGGRQLGRLAQQGRLGDYLERKGLADELGGWLAQAAPLRGRAVVTYHKTWIYFADRFGLTIPVEIEEKPGIPPSARHRDAVAELIRQRNVHTILQAVFYDRKAADYLAAKTGAHVAAVPIDVGADVGAPDYFALIDRILTELLASETAGG